MDIRHFITENRTPLIKTIGLFGIAVVIACAVSFIYRYLNVPAWIVLLSVYTAVVIQVVVMAYLNAKRNFSETIVTWLKREINVVTIAMWLCFLDMVINGI